jgi:hypothetical protein
MVVPEYKVSNKEDPPKKVQAKNSDMGSDGGYFSGPGPESDENSVEIVEDGDNKEAVQNSDDEYADFEYQQIDENDFIEDDFDVNEELEPIEDSYLTSQFDYMYSEDSSTPEMNDEEIR